ncbi:MAG: hypothetical protein HYY17_06040 [Planctomycetes bacterium]|nr:hypothetical protein [Planctomycetota bacterium]
MKGTVVYLYAFDVSAEIRTASIREVLSEKPFPFQIRVGATAPKDVRIYQPLTIGLKPEEVESSVGRVSLRPFVKLFDIGVLSISYEIPFETGSLDDLVAYHRLTIGGAPLDRRAEGLCAQLTRELAAYMDKPAPEKPPVEAYTVFCLEAIEGVAPGGVPGWARTHGREIAALLTEEAIPDRLSEDQIRETLRQSLSYTNTDFAVVDWDAALIVDQSGYYDDVIYVIELANLQLEEFHLLDDRLDRFFLDAYDDLESYSTKRKFFSSPQKALRTLRAIRMDITKMSEEVTNITKFVGDWYLARVYLACKDRFHLGHWESTVDQKLVQLDHLYQLVHTDTYDRRMLFLEAVIVLLFIVDLVALFFLKR